MQFVLEPAPITFVKTLKSIVITAVDIRLFESITFQITYYAESGGRIRDDSLIERVVIDKAEYLQWGADDNYILTKVLAAINANGANILTVSTNYDPVDVTSLNFPN